MLQSDNRVKPCCRFSESLEFNGAENTQSAFRSIREEMLAGEVPRGCEKCLEEERAGGTSKRMRSDHLLPKGHDANPPAINDSLVQYLEINLSSHCNLRCLMCSPERSSSWNRDAAAAGYPSTPAATADLSLVRPLLKNVKVVSLLGGETFLGPRLEEIIDLIFEEADPAGVELVLSTNLTVFPDEVLLEKLARFKEVDIGCSIDAVGARNEYIRFPSKWPEVENNFLRFRDWAEGRKNILLRLDATLSALSYPGLPNLLEWWNKNAPRRKSGRGREFICLNPVTTPEFQSVHALSRKVREEIAAKISSRQDLQFGNVMDAVRFSLHQDRQDLRERLWAWIEVLDRSRGISARQYAPEIFS